jgi:hypothetical protein
MNGYLYLYLISYGEGVRFYESQIWFFSMMNCEEQTRPERTKAKIHPKATT